nr:hypothetical protein Iba_chr01aCG0730 [Ipomoea batatas]GMC50836.1 hypothetical protein Iba_chr01cCG0600 [Ipomoea batatas]GMC52729.1 hypothetical protein Iba_chr01dCG0030 [Ipomoea batatas]
MNHKKLALIWNFGSKASDVFMLRETANNNRPEAFYLLINWFLAKRHSFSVVALIYASCHCFLGDRNHGERQSD